VNGFNNITKISSEEFRFRIAPVMQDIFNYPGSLLELFKPRLSYRIIDEHFGILPDQLLNALETIGVRDGYNGCYYICFDHDRLLPFELSLPNEVKDLNTGCWYVPFEKLGEIPGNFFIFCQSFISPKGDWGIFVTRDNFLLFGCTPEVGARLQQLVPELDESIYRFFKLYDALEQKLSIRWDWLPTLIHHLYDKKYDEILEKYNFYICDL